MCFSFVFLETKNVWAIQEKVNHWDYGFVYAEQITISNKLNKDYLNGGGNTASVALRYIYTYEATKGIINIGGSSKEL